MRAFATFCLAGFLLWGCAENTEDNSGGDSAQQSGAGVSGGTSQSGDGSAGVGGSAGETGQGGSAGEAGGPGSSGSGGESGTSGAGGQSGAAGRTPVAGEGGSDSGGQGGAAGSEEAGSGGSAGESGRTPSVETTDPLYQRYEAPAFDNRCTTDEQCMTTGCNGEVCAAEEVGTTCDVVPLPEGSCGCVDGECIWHLDGGGSGEDCQEDRDCTTYSDYCEGCNCLALPVGASPPACTGNQVQCFVDPCMNRTAICEASVCVLEQTGGSS